MSHPHSTVQPIETSHYTYDAHRPSAQATRNLVNQDPTQHSPTSPCGPTTRIHPDPIHPDHQPHTHHPEHHHGHRAHDHHLAEHEQDDGHPAAKHESHPQSPGSPSSTASWMSSSDNAGNEERRQSWSKEEMKREVMEGLLEKGKGKQAKGGYSSTS